MVPFVVSIDSQLIFFFFLHVLRKQALSREVQIRGWMTDCEFLGGSGLVNKGLNSLKDCQNKLLGGKYILLDCTVLNVNRHQFY